MFTILIEKGDFRALYRKEVVEYSKVYGDSSAPMTVYPFMIKTKFLYTGFAFEKLPL